MHLHSNPDRLQGFGMTALLFALGVSLPDLAALLVLIRWRMTAI